ncbi:MAG TPA: NAD(P)H-binding protein, partial [Patescibacteria group bacterium]|nr:NAD(P)H-binding protein [Patescibacteria group bacterium]
RYISMHSPATIAITGGTGFVGRSIARSLAARGRQLVLLARGMDRSDPAIRSLAQGRFIPCGVDQPADLAEAFKGCDAVIHCAGINREIGEQTFRRVHVEGTANVIRASHEAGVRKIVLLSFLRARPHCDSPYHESKWEAEELVRKSGLDYTILKCGVIYGRGDHMLNHLSRAFFTFPVFALVGFSDKPICPNAVEDVAQVVQSALNEPALRCRTVSVIGPDELTLREAVRRVARVVGRKPLMFPMPIFFHYVLARLLECIMAVPMVSVAQVRMLVEGLAKPAPACDPLPAKLAPKTHFTEQQIRKGLPPPRSFNFRDLVCCRNTDSRGKSGRSARVFFEMP